MNKLAGFIIRGVALDPAELLEDTITETKPEGKKPQWKFSIFIYTSRNSHINITSIGNSNQIFIYKLFPVHRGIISWHRNVQNPQVILRHYYKSSSSSLNKIIIVPQLVWYWDTPQCSWEKATLFVTQCFEKNTQTRTTTPLVTLIIHW